MVEAVQAVHAPHHLDLLQLLDGGRHRHVVGPGGQALHLLLEQAVDPAADDQGDELDEDLARCRLAAVDAQGPVAQVGLVPPEQLLALVAALVQVQGLAGVHRRRGDQDEVAAQAQPPLDLPLALPGEEQRLAVLGVEELVAVRERLGEGDLLPLAGLDEPAHALHVGLQFLALGALLGAAVVEVEVPLVPVIGVKPVHHGLCIDPPGPDRAGAAALEAALVRLDERADQLRLALDHDDEVEAHLIHIADVRLAEVAAVEDEAHVPVAVGGGRVHHVLQLRHVDDAARVLLVEERLALSHVVGDRVVEHRPVPAVLGVAALDDGDLPGPAVLVGRVVGDVDPLPVVAPAVPFVEERRGVLVRDGVEEGGDLAVAVHPHPPGEEGVGPGPVGVVLPRVVLADDRIRCQVEQEARLAAEQAAQHRLQAVVAHHRVDDDVRTHPQAAAAPRPPVDLGGRQVGEVAQVVRVGVHPPVVGQLADGGPLRDVVPAFAVVDAVVLVVDVHRPLDRLLHDLARHVGYLHQ